MSCSFPTVCPGVARAACLALSAGVAAIALMGCGGSPSATLKNFVEVSCQAAVNKYVDNIQAGYLDFIVEKCAAIRQKAEEELVNEERGEQIEQKCLDTAGVNMNLDTEAQKDNYTTMCIHGVMNGSHFTYSKLKGMILDFWEGQNLSQAIDDLVSPHLNKTFGDLLEEIKGDDSSSGSEKSGSGSNSSATTDLGSGSSGSSSGGGSSSASAAANETQTLKLFEDSSVQWGSIAKGSSRSADLRLPAAAVSGLAVALVAASVAAITTVARSQMTATSDLDVQVLE